MYDLAVIGAGWAGFNAAIRAKELGFKACLIESGSLGGTCLNSGCIPTKTLIACAKVFSLAKKSADFGISLDNLKVNFEKIQERKNKVIQEFALGMQGRLKQIDFIKSSAQIISANKIKVGADFIEAKFMLIATGSRPIQLPQLKFDHKKIISSDDALAITSIPASLLIIGGGVIGCEFAHFFSVLGSEVTVAEKMPLLLPGEDKDIAKKIEVIFKKKGIKVVTGADIASFDLNNYAKVLVCVGRAADVTGLGIENLGIRFENNKIVADEYLRTSVSNIYAAGDCASDLKLAHYASYQGKTAVENMVSGNKHKADNKIVPACIFTEPQIASVGLSEENALGAGVLIKVHKFDFRASAMAHIINETDGFIKVISNQSTGEVIGACIIGALASELIATISIAVCAHLTVEQIRAMIFAHPTLSESIHDAV